MAKVDLKKELKHLYHSSATEVVLVDVPDMNFLMIDGAGDPNKAQEFHDAIQVLYGVSFTLKFMIKKEQEIDYAVMPLEGLWWTDDMTQFSMDNKDIWKWTLMIMQPDYVRAALVDKAIEQVAKKKDPPALSQTRFERFHEGLSAQIMHIGPFAAEAPTIQKLHHFIEDTGHALRGKHHEIYLSDPRRAAPEKMKTVIRQPVR
jgi:hypothetical protein